MSSINNIIKNLNDSQLQFVLDETHNLRTIAGPGSGKTRAITHKIAYLIEEKNIPSYRILAVTFTNKAAKEMKKRTEDLVGHNDSKIFTFHGLCANILYRESVNTTYGSEFHIIDRKDQESILRKIYKKRDLSPRTLKFGKVLNDFGRFREEGLTTTSQIMEDATDEESKMIAEMYEEYLEVKQNSKALDFNDLIFDVLKLFQTHPEVKEK